MKKNVNKKSTLQRIIIGVLLLPICLLYIIASFYLITDEFALQSIVGFLISSISLLGSIWLTYFAFRFIFNKQTEKTTKFTKIIQFLVLTMLLVFIVIQIIQNPPPNLVRYLLFITGLILSMCAIIYLSWVFIFRKAEYYKDRLGRELFGYNWWFVFYFILFCIFLIGIGLIDETTLNGKGMFISGNVIGIILGITGALSHWIILRSERIGGLLLIILLITPFIEVIIFLNILKHFF